MSKEVIEKRGPFEVLDREVVYSNQWLSLEKDIVYNTKTDKEGLFTVVRYPNQAVAILPIGDDGKVHLIKEFKYAINKEIVQTPGGFMDSSETPLDAAKRELAEELGIIADTWEYHGNIFAYGSVNEAATHLYIAHGLSFGEQKLDENEAIEKIIISLPEAYKLVVENEITIAPCVVLIQQAMLKERNK